MGSQWGLKILKCPGDQCSDHGPIFWSKSHESMSLTVNQETNDKDTLYRESFSKMSYYYRERMGEEDFWDRRS